MKRSIQGEHRGQSTLLPESRNFNSKPTVLARSDPDQKPDN
ncbi:hypothetical protein SAMN03159306_02606 [Pseudomonas sp. NFACC48-1]|nr:hypothetical protein SAMN03159405_01695 [Pseudomonas sp. NFACC44-2]SDA73132.1 hypothetical protein SAMN03159429_03316 [Pseudomonas sp. NFACC51]SDX10604.1 hypothetical protein SAMN03159474_02297 [Pseudomonas sp. NFACC08-1]SEI72264.1 hypothetical protein SAMN03159298_01179 [Pseudomonas sp. NFACC07-1]SFH36326.1 hypothetical protein SAMN03159302_01310 [Pseudomonas sp. NFACC54]SFS91458.1 hypothetical protein SAMN03159306_02606 [Pseudomonas sp. NFACC48-1]